MKFRIPEIHYFIVLEIISDDCAFKVIYLLGDYEDSHTVSELYIKFKIHEGNNTLLTLYSTHPKV